MNNSIHVPVQLWQIRDEVIDAVYSGSDIPESISLIYKWLENDGWTELVDKNPNGDLAVSIHSFCSDDAELRLLLDLDDSVSISDLMRIQHTREQLQHLKINSISYDYLEITFCKIEDKNGRSAVLGAMFEAQQGGSEVYWTGVFATSEQFVQSLKLNGLWTVDELEAIDDESILQCWRN